MKRLILALVACAAALLPRLAVCEQVPNLYETVVPVVSQGEEARRAGLIAALEGVLVKLSGMSDVAQRGVLADALNAPERYVDQFRYVTPPGASGQSLWVRFDGGALEQLLRAKSLPVWSATRPAVVVWLAVEEQGRRVFAGAGEATPATTALQAAADRRGLPLRLPLLDLEDQGRLQPADVWGNFSDAIRAASARYHGQAVLTGALFQESSAQWRARWTLYRDEAVVRQWESSGALVQVVDSGIDATVDTLARAFATVSDNSAGGPLVVRITGVRNMEAYLRVTNYLRGIGGVTTVQPVEVAGDEVLLSVALQGPAQGFTQAVSLGDTLAPVQNPAAPATELTYRLVQ